VEGIGFGVYYGWVLVLKISLGSQATKMGQGARGFGGLGFRN